ncbi:MAG: (2Fe-2S)-binding protein [Rhodobacteraceae bacterium]|nr:(2Fe-2S)-binding protein [Paracoccaceae bacterium]
MARRLQGIGTPVRFTFEGVAVEAAAGDTVAAALLAAGHRDLRPSAVSGAPRGPYCLMGACFDCLVRIDGAPNRQACMTEVAPGMDVRRMAHVGKGEGR